MYCIPDYISSATPIFWVGHSDGLNNRDKIEEAISHPEELKNYLSGYDYGQALRINTDLVLSHLNISDPEILSVLAMEELITKLVPELTIPVNEESK